MASKLISSKGVKIQKLIYRKAKIYVSQQFFNSPTKNVNLNHLKDIVNTELFNISAAKLKNLPRNALIKVPRAPIKCPRVVSAGRFLAKGCSAAICTVRNPEYESQLIMKQPYRYDTEFVFTEGAFLAKLSNRFHPNIIHYFGESETAICSDPAFTRSCPDVRHHGDTSSLILERMDGNLEELLQIRQNDLSVLDRVDILSQILEAQVYMRSQSICHRDLKPANILTKCINNSSSIFKFPTRFSIKVADFDCALDLSAPGMDKVVTHQGTPDRMAPELLNHTFPVKAKHIRSVYSKSDIWAIGTLVYELFDSTNPFSQINAANYSIEDLPELPSAPNLVQKLLKHLLEPDWSTRFQACIASDILQLFRFKSVVNQSVFELFKTMSLNLQVGCCFIHQMYLAGPRFLANPNRLQFAINFVEEH